MRTGGTNILRGGKRTYQCKTLIGNFVEESYRPGATLAGFSGGAIYQSTTRSQMQEGAGECTPEFGLGLRRNVDTSKDIDAPDNIIAVEDARNETTWVSVTKSAHCGKTNELEFTDKMKSKASAMSDDELRKHRARWTTESPHMMYRYTTSNQLTMGKQTKSESTAQE